MLVYANHLSFTGAGAESAIFKGIGGWLKEQLGFGLHPDQLKNNGDFNGLRGDVSSRLRILVTAEEEPELYSWVLKFRDDTVYGRQWIVEVGVKRHHAGMDLSCVVKTDEHSTLVDSPVTASQPRLIRYVVSNVQQTDNANFAGSVPGIAVKNTGQDRDSYRALLAEIERRDRDSAIVLVSPTRDGNYLLNVADLQQRLIGLAQVVQIDRDFNSYEMADVVGQSRSAWGGAVNLLYVPTASGHIRGRLFLSETIVSWGSVPHDRISQILAWVTNNTNIPRLRRHIRPEGVMQLSLRRRMQATRARSEEMDAAELRSALNDAARQSAEQEQYFNELVEENSQLEDHVSVLKSDLEDIRDDLAKKDFTIQSLKDQLIRAGGEQDSTMDVASLVEMACRTDPPTPLECIDLIGRAYPDRCTFLPSATSSAERMASFIYGRELLELLRRLVTDYRTQLMDGGDSKARTVFGKNEYAAKESETVMGNKAMRRERTFDYDGQKVEMYRHLKIGVDDDVTKTIRVYFHWDAERGKIVVGYCGEHLSISSH